MGADGGQPEASHHQITNILIELDGERARTESYFCAVHRQCDDAGSWDEQVRGRYLDDFERRDGAWKIARRIPVWDWSRVDPAGMSWTDRASGDHVPDHSFIFGRRDRQDPVYTYEVPDNIHLAGLGTGGANHTDS